MNKLCNIYKSLLTGILLLVTAIMFAQPETFNRAQQLYRDKNTQLAAQTIDSVIVYEGTENDREGTKYDPISWTSRAYIYYDLYRTIDKYNNSASDKISYKLESSLRDTVIASIKKSYSLNPTSDYIGENDKIINAIKTHYNNIATKLLQDSLNYERSLIAYNKFKEITRINDPLFNFRTKDIDYYLAAGSIYSDIFTKDPKNTKAQEIAKTALMHVLDLDPNNPSANINLGLMYYNQAANLSREMDYGADISQIDFVQESMVKLAKQAEPFVLKVYSNDNNHEKAITALFYIYRMLNDIPKSDEYKEKLKRKGVNLDDEGKPIEETKPQDGTTNDKNKK